MAISKDVREKIDSILKDTPGAVLEQVAMKSEATAAEVVHCLPSDQVVHFPAERFESIMAGVSELGRITFIVHTEDIVMECKGEVPEGSFGRGYFNIHGDSPLSGHIKAERCKDIFFISRPLMGRESHSIQFYNVDGGCMYKIYLGRDEKRELIPEQVERFKALVEKLSQ